MERVLVLTAPPARGLSEAEIRAVAQAVGAEASAVRRLGSAAAEMTCPVALSRAELDTLLPGIDANLVPVEGRRKRLLVADMDSTIITVECIDEIAAAAGVGERVAAITERAMAGELEFESALRERVALFRGLPARLLDEVFAERIRLSPGAGTLVRTMAAHGAHTALVSGGFTFFTERVARLAGFAEHRANRLVVREGRLTGEAEKPILGRDAKLTALREMTARLGVTPAEALAVGDGANDLALIEAAGLGVAWRPKPVLAAAADAVIRHADLTALLHLQGYSEREFVTGGAGRPG